MEPLDSEYSEIGKAVWEYYRHRCSVQVRHAIERGSLPPLRKLKCVDCGKRAAAYDHRNYAHPLDVSPVCNACNFRRGHAELSVDVIMNHLREHDDMPFENKRLRVMEKSRWRQACACCDPEKHFVSSHSQENIDYLLTIW